MDFEARDVVLVRRNLVLHGGAFSPLVLGMGMLLLALLTGSGKLAAVGALLAWVGYFTSFITLTKNLRPHLRHVALRAGEDGLFLDGERFATRGEISRAYLQPSPGESSSVRIVAGRRRLDLRLAKPSEERALLAALGHGVAQRAASWSVRVGKDVSALSLIALFLCCATSLAALALTLHALGLGVITLPAILASVVAYLFLSGRPATVTVGADGVHVAEARGPSFVRFVPYAAIERVDTADLVVKIDVRGQPPLLLRFAQRYHHGAVVPDEAAFVARLSEALDVFRDRAVADEPAPRSSEDTHEWLATVRAVASDVSAAYRTAAVAPELLWGLVEDPTIDGPARAGAAAMLMRVLDEDGRARLRVVGESCASPSLRVALDAIASGSPEEATFHEDELAPRKRYAG